LILHLMNSISIKKWMAFAGLTWLTYVIFHALSLLNFHFGKGGFNGFYAEFDQTPIYYLMLAVLAFSFALHVVIAVSRQLKNNAAMGDKYHHTYPKAIPRFVAWGGASTLFGFIVFHFWQMQLLDKTDLYQQMFNIFTQPVMLLIYVFGVITLSAHLHHALTSVLQTLGITSRRYDLLVIILISILMLSFASVPVSVIYA